MKLSKIFVIIFLCMFGLLTVACSKDGESFTVKVYDIDEELTFNKDILIKKYNNLYEVMINELDYEVENKKIIDLNSTIKDKNWKLVCYKNNILIETNDFQTIKINNNDLIEFKKEFIIKDDLDEYDALLDKIIYHYLKTTFKSTLESTLNYSASTYWEMLMVDMIDRSGLDKKLININYNNELKESINNTNIEELTGANLGKYYIHAKVLNLVSNNFSSHYQEELNNLSYFDSYSTPFVLIPNAYLKIDSDNFNNVINQEIIKDITWGPTSDLWSYISKSVFIDMTDKLNLNDYCLDWTKQYEFGNACDFCTVIMATSASGLDIRNTSIFNKIEYNNQELDYLAYLLTRYYDSTLSIIKLNDNDTTESMSANQIYAALLAYKVYKYTNNKANIFGPNN